MRRIDEIGGNAGAVFTLENAGVRARILGYGGALMSLEVPDRHGEPGDVALGFDDLDGYLHSAGYLGALIGRHANRIAGARFTLDGTEFRLTANEGPNQLHGGKVGFDKVVWEVTPRETSTGPALELAYTSRDGEEGYPGNLSVRVVYTLTDDRALRIDYAATTDRDTVVSLTHHGYWNLAGHAAGSILDHRLTLEADRFVPVGEGQLPTGELRPVQGTPFDFRTATAIGARIAADDEQLRIGGGYDHSFEIRGEPGDLRPAARVAEPTTGRVLEVWTTAPALQLYTGNQLDGARGKAGAVYERRAGLCLETQGFPDAPNQPGFPSTVLRAGARYASTSVYRFLVE